MLDQLGQTESILVVVICVAFLTFYVWSKRYLNSKVAQAGKVDEYTKFRTSWRRVSYPIAGALLIAFVLFNQDRIPPENKPLVFMAMGFGAALVLYGVFSWLRRRK